MNYCYVPTDSLRKAPWNYKEDHDRLLNELLAKLSPDDLKATMPFTRAELQFLTLTPVDLAATASLYDGDRHLRVTPDAISLERWHRWLTLVPDEPVLERFRCLLVKACELRGLEK